MVIIQDVPGLKVGILINGIKAEEHKPNHDPYPYQDGVDPKTCPVVCRYIACPDDGNFEIVCRVTDQFEWGYGLDVGKHDDEKQTAADPDHPQPSIEEMEIDTDTVLNDDWGTTLHALAFSVSVDGRDLQAECVHHLDLLNWRDCYVVVRGRESVDPFSRFPFLERMRFRSIMKIAQLCPELRTHFLTHMGTIHVKVYRGIIEPFISKRNLLVPISSLPGADTSRIKVNGALLRSPEISHGTCFDRVVNGREPKVFGFKRMLNESENGPIAMFKFYYRPPEFFGSVIFNSTMHGPPEDILRRIRDKIPHAEPKDPAFRGLVEKALRRSLRIDFLGVVDVLEDDDDDGARVTTKTKRNKRKAASNGGGSSDGASSPARRKTCIRPRGS